MQTFWKFAASAALCTLWTMPVMAQKRVNLMNGKVSLVPPPGFNLLSRAEIKRHFPSVGTPQFAWAGKGSSTLVALTISPEQLTPAQLPQLKRYMESFLPRVAPGLHWEKRETTTWKNRRWIHLEFTATWNKKKLYNDLYFTSHQNRVFGMVLNTPLTQRGKTRAVLTRCRQSLVLQGK